MHWVEVTRQLGALNYEYSILNKSIGKEVGLKHIYSGKSMLEFLKVWMAKLQFLKNGKKTKK